MTTPDPGAPVATYCYRHPDRESYVRCGRCDRVICPDCMTEAAVGFQCPECVAEGRATVRSPLTQFGGKIDSRASVTLTLIGICVAVFGIEFVAGVNSVLENYGAWPFGIAINGEQWRLFTAVFLHVNLLHLLFNMYVLYLLGPQLERLFGHSRFLVLYLVAGLGGSVASYWFSQPNVVSAGASGAIFGLMGALVVAGHAVRADITQVLVLIGINLAIGFLVGGIDWRAHLGGLVTGAVVAAILAYAPRSQRLLVQSVGIVLVVGGLLLAVVVRTDQLQDQVRAITGG
ncbi:MAG TPA: rhomboid family intramembrane serine protease [Candidatus Nanopelagicales bacterium]|nr:rhomboid family intramembrane serine protease [Candidatus Nanopelagicales bacterium]